MQTAQPALPLIPQVHLEPAPFTDRVTPPNGTGLRDRGSQRHWLRRCDQHRLALTFLPCEPLESDESGDAVKHSILRHFLRAHPRDAAEQLDLE